MRELEIDNELRDLLVEVHGDDLDKQIDDGGPREPIIVAVWPGRDGEDVKRIADGHRRYEICRRRKLPFRVEEMPFAHKAAVAEWMIRNQASRRNWSEVDKAKAAVKLQRMISEVLRKGGDKPSKAERKATKEAAKLMGVHERTVYRRKRFGEAIEALPEPIRERIASGEIPAQKGDVVELATLHPNEQVSLVAQVDAKEFPSLHEALFGDSKGETHLDGDAEPAEQPTKKPPRKPAVNLFDDAIRLLGQTKKAVNLIGDALPGPFCQRAIDTLTKAGGYLADWRKRAKVEE